MQRLPDLIDKINESYDAVQAAIRELPAPPTNDARTEMLGLVTAFHRELEASVQGSRHSEKLVQDVNAIYREFKDLIWSTAPRYTPYTRKEIEAKEAQGEQGTFEQDVVGQLKDLQEGTFVKRGVQGPTCNLDDVRKHIKT